MICLNLGLSLYGNNNNMKEGERDRRIKMNNYTVIMSDRSLKNFCKNMSKNMQILIFKRNIPDVTVFHTSEPLQTK